MQLVVASRKKLLSDSTAAVVIFDYNLTAPKKEKKDVLVCQMQYYISSTNGTEHSYKCSGAMSTSSLHTTVPYSALARMKKAGFLS